MASSHVEFGSYVLNRPSKPKTTSRYEKNNNGYLQSCIASINSSITSADFDTENLKSQNNVDLSWLPNYDNDNSVSESHHHNGEIDFDYSWLPDHFDTKRNGSTVASKPSTSNRSGETENDSWLPSIPIVNGEIDDSWLPNYNDVKKTATTVPSKPNSLIRSRKTENDSNYSRLTNGNQNKETIKNKKLKNQNNWEPAYETVSSREQQIQHEKPSNKKPEISRSQGQASPSELNRCSVETDSLGGVSTLRRRFQDLTETGNTQRKAKSSSGSNRSKSALVLTKGNNNSPPGSPATFFDASDGVSSPSTTADLFFDVESDKIQVPEIIKKLSEEEELVASQAAENTNESFARICHKQVAGGKTRLIRGRQAFEDFLNLMEQDKQSELENLAHRKSVSQFSHRGRLRALLRVRFIKFGNMKKQERESITISNQSAKGAKHRQITELTTPVNKFTDKTREIDSSSHSTQLPNRSDYDEKALDDDIQLEIFHDCSNEYSQSQTGDEKEEEEEDWDMEPFHDWISEVSRPKSYWECLRQARYKEMRHRYSYKQDLQQLLERRSVTGFLSSDIRGKLNQLMMIRVKGIESRKKGMGGEGEEDEDDVKRIQGEYKEYNEFIDQRSSPIVSCC